MLCVRSLSDSSKRQPAELLITTDPRFEMVDLLKDDVLFNVVTPDNALKRKSDGKFWRGPKEKSVALMQLLIGGLCPRAGLVADLTTGTGERFLDPKLTCTLFSILFSLF
jgi:hypothetical protein